MRPFSTRRARRSPDASPGAAPRAPRSVGGLFDDIPNAPGPAEKASGFGAYVGEFGRGIGRGAAGLAGTFLKGAAAVQTAGARGMQRFIERQSDLMARIDRGEAL